MFCEQCNEKLKVTSFDGSYGYVCGCNDLTMSVAYQSNCLPSELECDEPRNNEEMKEIIESVVGCTQDKFVIDVGYDSEGVYVCVNNHHFNWAGDDWRIYKRTSASPGNFKAKLLMLAECLLPELKEKEEELYATSLEDARESGLLYPNGAFVLRLRNGKEPLTLCYEGRFDGHKRCSVSMRSSLDKAMVSRRERTLTSPTEDDIFNTLNDLKEELLQDSSDIQAAKDASEDEFYSLASVKKELGIK